MKLKGTVTITADSGGEVHIDIQDDSSRVLFCSVRMTKAEFATGLFGLSSRPCVVTTRGLDKLGMKAENQTVAVTVERARMKQEQRDGNYVPTKACDAYLDVVLHDYEAEGWHATRGDFFNSHGWVKQSDDKLSTHNVSMFRHVPA